MIVTIITCLTFVGAIVCLYVHDKRKVKSELFIVTVTSKALFDIVTITELKINDSTSRVCNAMVHNPIYDGPVYESVQTQFETLTNKLQARQTHPFVTANPVAQKNPLVVYIQHCQLRHHPK